VSVGETVRIAVINMGQHHQMRMRGEITIT
jgi:hypothetical protein